MAGLALALSLLALGFSLYGLSKVSPFFHTLFDAIGSLFRG